MHRVSPLFRVTRYDSLGYCLFRENDFALSSLIYVLDVEAVGRVWAKGRDDACTKSLLFLSRSAASERSEESFKAIETFILRGISDRV